MDFINTALSRHFNELSKHSNSTQQGLTPINPNVTSREYRGEGFEGDGTAVEHQQVQNDPINWHPAPDFLQLESTMVAYSFAISNFGAAENGAEYQKLVDNISNQLKAHIQNASQLIAANEKIAKFEQDTEELIRLAIGRTQLLINKRIKQFIDHLDQYIHPIPKKKPTKLEDLHGLWALIEMQMEDIRTLWTSVEQCRLANWKYSTPRKEKNNNKV